MSAKSKSTAQKKIDAVVRLRRWIEEKVKDKVLDQYIRNGKLNRSEIAMECGFARSSFSSNDLLAAELRSSEEHLIRSGVLKESSDAGERKASSNALEAKLANREREINALRERLAIKTAEIEELKRRLTSSNSLLDDIIPSGRRVEM